MVSTFLEVCFYVSLNLICIVVSISPQLKARNPRSKLAESLKRALYKQRKVKQRKGVGGSKVRQSSTRMHGDLGPFLVIPHATPFLERENDELKKKVAKKDQLKKKLVDAEEALAEVEAKKAEEIAQVRVEAVEAYKILEKLKDLILDKIVDEQYSWEKKLMRFNPIMEINF